MQQNKSLQQLRLGARVFKDMALYCCIFLTEQLLELLLAVRGQAGPQSRGRRWLLQARGGIRSDMRFLRLLSGGAAGTTRPTQAALQR